MSMLTALLEDTSLLEKIHPEKLLIAMKRFTFSVNLFCWHEHFKQRNLQHDHYKTTI